MAVRKADVLKEKEETDTSSLAFSLLYLRVGPLLLVSALSHDL